MLVLMTDRIFVFRLFELCLLSLSDGVGDRDLESGDEDRDLLSLDGFLVVTGDLDLFLCFPLRTATRFGRTVVEEGFEEPF